MRLIEKVWRGRAPLSRIARTALIPLGGVYRAAVEVRGWLYEHRLLRIHRSSIQVVSVGNLSVGGTGKTPFAAWLARELANRGGRPAIVLRGYGGDEPLVHARLNREIPVIIEKRRTDGIAQAAQLGATVAVLDDAFQHRVAGRLIDIVLLAAEQWEPAMHLLPAGPWREPLSAVRRAALVVITRKTAEASRVDALSRAVSSVAPEVPQAVVRFDMAELRRAASPHDHETLPMEALADRAVIGVAGVGEPDAFFQQLADTGAQVTRFAFPDHHRYSTADISSITNAVGAGDATVVCTLKDAVKLVPMWPATGPPLWYVLQRMEIESGAEPLARLLTRLSPEKSAEE